MRSKWRYLIVCSALLMTGMRDPFRPPEDRCAAGQLAQWQYRGKMNEIGFLLDGEKRWHRVKVDERLAVGWRVVSLDEEALVIMPGVACELKQWQWQREGAKHDKKDSAVTDNTRYPGVGRRAEAGHPGGG